MLMPMCPSLSRKRSAAQPSPIISSSCSPRCRWWRFLAWQLVPRTFLGLDGWRWVVIVGSIGAFIIWWIRRNLPESPRWLEQHGRTAEAESIVAELERRIRADGVKLSPPEIVAGET